MATAPPDATRPLFGGAVSCCIPAEYVDVSSFRQVPDNQEAFSDPQSDRSVIVEILEYVSAVELAGTSPPTYFFNDLAEANGAEPGSVRVVSSTAVPAAQACPALPAAEVEVYRLTGEQRIAKTAGAGAAATASLVTILLLNIRCASIQSDIVVTMNVPSAPGGGGDDDSDAAKGGAEAAAMFDALARSFTVHDWSLFG